MRFYEKAKSPSYIPSARENDGAQFLWFPVTERLSVDKNSFEIGRLRTFNIDINKQKCFPPRQWSAHWGEKTLNQPCLFCSVSFIVLLIIVWKFATNSRQSFNYLFGAFICRLFKLQFRARCCVHNTKARPSQTRSNWWTSWTRDLTAPISGRNSVRAQMWKGRSRSLGTMYHGNRPRWARRRRAPGPITTVSCTRDRSPVPTMLVTLVFTAHLALGTMAFANACVYSSALVSTSLFSSIALSLSLHNSLKRASPSAFWVQWRDIKPDEQKCAVEIKLSIQFADVHEMHFFLLCFFIRYLETQNEVEFH